MTHRRPDLPARHLLALAGLAALACPPPTAPAAPPTDEPATAARVAPADRPDATADPADFRRYGRWVSSALGGGGYIQEVVPTSDPAVYYARVDVAGLARSDDGGRSWHLVHGGYRPYAPGVDAVRGVSPDPRDPDRVVAAAGDRWSEPVGIIATDDGGETWQLRQPGLFLGNADTRNAGPILARSPDDPDLIYAAGVGANFVSRDGGATWEPFGPTGLHATSLAVDRSNPDRLWLAATAAEIQVTHLGGKTKFDGGWFVSDDGGATFRKVADEAPREFAQSHDDPGVLLGLFGINDVRRSDDGGRTWSDLTAGLPLDGTGGFNDWSRTSSALTAAPGRAVLVTRDGTVFELPTGAAEWRRVGPESVDGRGWYGNLGRRPGWVHFGKAAGDVLVDPHDPSRWFFTDWYALWRSDDAGRTWAFAADGLEATVIHAIAATPGDGAHVHLGMADNGYLLSTDGGATFTNVEGLPVGDSNAKAIAVSPADPQRVYLTGNTKAGAWESTGLGVSADGGQTWSAAPAEGLPDMAGRMMCSVAVDPTGATSIAVGVSGKVGDGGGAYLSDDGGATFRLVADGLPTGGGYFRNDVWVCGREIAIGPGGGTVAFSHDRKLVHRLAPGASAWEAAGLEPAGKPNDVVADSANPGRFYLAVGGDGLYRSDDGGATFSQVWQGDARRVDVSPDGSRVVAGVGSDAGVVFSDDGGATFAPLDDALPNRDRPVVAFGGAGFGRVLAGTNGNGTFYLPLTDADAGAERSDFADRPPAERPAFDPRQAEGGGAGEASPDDAVFPHGDMASLDGWRVAYTGSGKLALDRDADAGDPAPPSLRLATAGGPAYGTAAFRLPDDVESLKISGRARADGKLDEAFVAVQSFGFDGKQLRFDVLHAPAADGEWHRFGKSVSRPDGAKSWSVSIVLRGDGTVRLDDLAAEVKPKP